ncbi:MAG: hypothetical protein FJZ80_09325 [Bacteroidetes bacterium]|nr:hypothetical protein [Bacteroidota bacterium]MBM3425291.1 hypothetical protein [Bacteroidota bacterium]
MKKILFSLLLVMAISAGINAQVYVVAASKTEYATQKANGVITFRFGADVLPETIITNGENFAGNFTTAFDATTYVGTFTMKENTEMNRLMLGRLLIMCGVEVVEFEGAQMPVYQFSNEQLK